MRRHRAQTSRRWPRAPCPAPGRATRRPPRSRSPASARRDPPRTQTHPPRRAAPLALPRRPRRCPLARLERQRARWTPVPIGLAAGRLSAAAGQSTGSRADQIVLPSHQPIMLRFQAGLRKLLAPHPHRVSERQRRGHAPAGRCRPAPPPARRTPRSNAPEPPRPRHLGWNRRDCPSEASGSDDAVER